MTEQEANQLLATVTDLAAKIQRFKDRCIGEQNTKASLIEPMLQALGWDIRDPDEVHHEYKPTSRDNPVDYALCLQREPRLFVEAKGLGELGEMLADRKWIAQVLGYATVAGVEWCILTDGNEYRFYNSTAAVDAEEKLFCRVKLSESNPEEAAAILSLLSRSDLQQNRIDVLWAEHFVDRRVKYTIRELFESADRGLIRLIRRHVRKLKPKEIQQSLKRLSVRIESPAMPPLGTGKSAGEQSEGVQPKRRGGAGKKAAATRKLVAFITLEQILGAGILTTPLKLFRKYKGQRLEADLLPDGRIAFQGVTFDSCSKAAEVARKTVTGRDMNTNGWVFWRYLDAGGKRRKLADARLAFAKMKAKGL